MLMDKKDIYEHLAKIYLDASSKKKKKNQENLGWRILFFISLAVILSLIVPSFINTRQNKFSKSCRVALVLHPDIAKINFNFDPAKKEIFSIDLKQLNLSRYKSLQFSIKKDNYKDNLCLKVEFTNKFKEKSSVYLRSISNKWQEFKIAFSDFKNITNWSNMSELSFIIEEWNVKDKKDIVYVDDIKVTK